MKVTIMGRGGFDMLGMPSCHFQEEKIPANVQWFVLHDQYYNRACKYLRIATIVNPNNDEWWPVLLGEYK